MRDNQHELEVREEEKTRWVAYYISDSLICQGGKPERRRYDPPNTNTRSGSGRGKPERNEGESELRIGQK